MLYITTNCPYLLETLPALAIDKRNPEDADSAGDDHVVDALRYLCKERLLESKYSAPEPVFNRGLVRLQAYIAQVRREAGRAKI